MKLFPKDKKWVPYTIAGCVTVTLFVLLSHVGAIFHAFGVIWNFILPVVLGAIIAYVIHLIRKADANIKAEHARKGKKA